MEEKNLKCIVSKKYLSAIILAAASILAIFLVVLTISQIDGIKNKIKEGGYIGQGSQYKNTITISGEGKVLAKPDIGQVVLSVVSQASTVAAAQKDNTEKMNKITKSMKDIGVKDDDLKTVGYEIYPRYQYRQGRSEIIGYEITQSLQVKIRNLDQAGQILDKAATEGANQVGSLEFTFDEPAKFKDEARQKAIGDAKQKAEALAKVLGVSLAKITGFSESVSGEPAPMYQAKALGIGGGSEAPEIQTGQNEIQATVNLTYEIY